MRLVWLYAYLYGYMPIEVEQDFKTHEYGNLILDVMSI